MDFIVDLSTIARKYARGYLVVDVISSVPVSLIDRYAFDEEDEDPRRVLRLLKLLSFL